MTLEAGGLHYLVNRRGEEGYYLAIFNHSGVVRTQKKGDEILPEATVTVTVELKDSRALKALEGSKEIRWEFHPQTPPKTEAIMSTKAAFPGR